jgi:hypothetical protein
VSRRSREHTSDEFGKPGLGPAAAIGDRGLGAASGVLVDGLVERERGVTPGPGVSSRTITIGLLVMVVVAVVVLVAATVLSAPRPLPAGSYPDVWIGLGSAGEDGPDTRFVVETEAAVDDEVTWWAATVDPEASITIDGRSADAEGLAEYLEAGMWRASVTADAEGVVSRVEVVTEEVGSSGG